jgi:hypothetical protein
MPYRMAGIVDVVANRLCHLIWTTQRNGVPYKESGPAVSKQFQHRHGRSRPR